MKVRKFVLAVLALFVLETASEIRERSLAIIFDGTGSMGKDLEQLRSAAKKIIENLSAQERNHITEYVLVVYRDPDIEAPFVTKKPRELIAHLDKIKVHGGGDCPEVALTGTEIALKLVKPQSFAFIFTDADAKDFDKESEVIDLIKSKEILLNVLLTGRCGREFASDGNRVYYKLATHGRGQVLNIKKDDIDVVLSSFIPQLQVDYDLILEEMYDEEKFNVFYVDDTMDKVNVKVAGNNPTIEIKDPHNNPVNTTTVVDLPNLKVVEVDKPEKGKYSIYTNADSSYTLKVGGETKIHFNYGFSVTPTDGTTNLTHQIIDNAENIITISVDNPENVKQLSHILIKARNSDGSEYKIRHKLSKIDEKVYQTNPINFPQTSFEIYVEGTDSEGDVFERFIKPVVIEKEPEVPKQFHEIIEGNDLKLSCGSSSEQGRAKKSWFFNNELIFTEKSDVSKELEYEIKAITRDKAGKYECKIEGNDEASTKTFDIRVIIRPFIELISNIDELKIGSNCTLKCNYQSSKPVNVTWTDERGNVLQTDNQIFTFIVPRNIKMKQIHCNVASEDFNFRTTVNFAPRASNKIECNVNAAKIWPHLGKLKTCDANSFPENPLDVTFTSDDPTTKILAFSLSHTKIKKFPSNLNEILRTQLVALQCTDAGISEVHAQDLQPYGLELQYLDLSDNKLIVIEKNLFEHNVNLRVIQLGGNSIAFIDGNVFDSVAGNQLVSLSLSNNVCVDSDTINVQQVHDLVEEVKGSCSAQYVKWRRCEL